MIIQKNKAAVALGKRAKGHKKTMSPLAILSRRRNAIAGWITRKRASAMADELAQKEI